MNSLFDKLKLIINQVENGILPNERLNELDKAMDSIIYDQKLTKNEKVNAISPNDNLIIKHTELLKIKEASEFLLRQENRQLLDPIIFNYLDPENNIRRLNLNIAVINNLIQSDKSEIPLDKLLFSHWKFNLNQLKTNFHVKNNVWDYYLTINFENVHRVYALGLDVYDDFQENPMYFPEPQKFYFEDLSFSPFKEPIFVFFVNRKSIFYLDKANIIKNASFKKTDDIKYFRVEITKPYLSDLLKFMSKENVEEQLIMLSDLIKANIN